MTAARPLALDDDSVLVAIDRAPLGEPFTPEEHAEILRDIEDIRAGRVQMIPGEEVTAMIAEKGRRWIECAACAGVGEDDDHDCPACGGSGGFCKTCGKNFRACVDVNACEPPGAPWAERRRAAAG